MQRADDLQGEHDEENRENREHERPDREANRAGDDSGHQRDVERNHSQRTQAQGCAAAHQVKHHALGTLVPPVFEEHVLRQPARQVIRGADDARERRAGEQNCAVHRGFLVRIRRQCRVSAELQHDGKHTQHARTHRHIRRNALHQLRGVIAFLQLAVVDEFQRAVGEDAQDAVAVYVNYN